MPGPGPTGEPVVRWRYRIESWEAYSSPAVVDGVVYVGSSSGLVFAIDAATGTELWRISTEDAVFSSPAVDGGTVYIGSGAEDFAPGILYALDGSTGAERWRFATNGAVFGAPAIASGTVFVGSTAGEVYALDGTSGAERWTAHAGAALNTLAVADGAVYLTPMWTTGWIAAIDAGTGETRWRTALDPTLFLSPPAVAGGTVYVGLDPRGRDDTVLIALDAATGQERWRHHRAAAASGILQLAIPAIADGIVYVVTEGILYAVDADTGEEHWRVAIGSAVESSPAVADGTLYFGTSDGSVIALDAATGEERWRLAISTSADVNSSPAVVDGVVYVASDDTYLYAIGGTGEAASMTMPP
jgi:outer membrane protein assembly factor BamB